MLYLWNKKKKQFVNFYSRVILTWKFRVVIQLSLFYVEITVIYLQIFVTVRIIWWMMKFAWWWPCVCPVSACPWCYHFITPVPPLSAYHHLTITTIAICVVPRSSWCRMELSRLLLSTLHQCQQSTPWLVLILMLDAALSCAGKYFFCLLCHTRILILDSTSIAY